MLRAARPICEHSLSRMVRTRCRAPSRSAPCRRGRRTTSETRSELRVPGGLVLLAHHPGEAGRHHLRQRVVPDRLDDVIESEPGDQMPAAGSTHGPARACEREGTFAASGASPKHHVRRRPVEQGLGLDLARRASWQEAPRQAETKGSWSRCCHAFLDEIEKLCGKLGIKIEVGEDRRVYCLGVKIEDPQLRHKQASTNLCRFSRAAETTLARPSQTRRPTWQYVPPTSLPTQSKPAARTRSVLLAQHGHTAFPHTAPSSGA